ncbi:ATP-binding cassette domain-containing protein [Lactiplantibacillus songbeiensis]|uniref:ATP-binding cassette domain-containing protein n=1 Tax=Lactiplantibacillus songbeiensis TaxID=2559920 RepID=A0ABW4C3P4_9LACO|nr:ATP-binding cassette domain-containing protein [Lactiplantibacillus songbeiensis]
MNAKVINVQELSRNFSLGKGKFISVLKSISFFAYANEFISIVGPSGSGKSTLLKCMSGLLKPTQGSIKIDAIDPYRLLPSKTARMHRTKIGFIFQSYNLVPALPVFENVVLPLRCLANKSIKQVLNGC